MSEGKEERLAPAWEPGGARCAPLRPAPAPPRPSARPACPGALPHRWDTAVPFVGQSGKAQGLVHGSRTSPLSSPPKAPPGPLLPPSELAVCTYVPDENDTSTGSVTSLPTTSGVLCPQILAGRRSTAGQGEHRLTSETSVAAAPTKAAMKRWKVIWNCKGKTAVSSRAAARQPGRGAQRLPPSPCRLRVCSAPRGAWEGAGKVLTSLVLQMESRLEPHTFPGKAFQGRTPGEPRGAG